MSEKPAFPAEGRFVAKALENGKVFFPISKADLLIQAGDEPVKVDWDRYVPLRSIVERFVPDYFENAISFFTAYTAERSSRASGK